MPAAARERTVVGAYNSNGCGEVYFGAQRRRERKRNLKLSGAADAAAAAQQRDARDRSSPANERRTIMPPGPDRFRPRGCVDARSPLLSPTTNGLFGSSCHMRSSAHVQLAQSALFSAPATIRRNCSAPSGGGAHSSNATRRGYSTCACASTIT